MTQERRSSGWSGLLRLALLLAPAVAGCATAPRSASDPGGAGWILPAAASADGPIEVLLTERVDRARVPVASTDAERIVFGHLYEGLAVPGPRGRPEPRLARAWLREGDHAWTIHLREGVRFADGSSFAARDVAVSWALAREAHPTHPIWGWIDPSEVRAEGSVLRIATKRPCPDLPTLLLDPVLAIWAPRAPGGWPVGTGPLWFPRPVSAQGPLHAVPNDHAIRDHPVAVRPVLFRVDARLDPRDMVGSEADAILVRDRDALRFLRDAGFESAELPWDRVYCWLGRSAPPSFSGEEFAELVVTAEAAVWPGPPPASGSEPVPPGSPPREIRYPPEDRDAGRIARRLAASLSAGGVPCAARAEGGPIVAAPDLAWIVPIDVPAGGSDGRGEGPALPAETVRAAGDLLSPAGEAPGPVLRPLLLTRARLVYAPGLSGVWVDASARPRFECAGRRAAGRAELPPVRAGTR